MFRKKLVEWSYRYAPSLAAAILVAIIFANLTRMLVGSIIVAAIVATWADNIAFYGIIAYRDIKSRKSKDKKITITGLLKVMRNLFVEFGPAEYFDSFILRPFWLSVFPYFISNYSLAILLGSLAAEVSYFIPTIISYEARKKLFKD
ncbi:MAG: hypothetical protein Q8O03_01475 [Nanoarchaeota archaeon]|nr:hypothetical protein [Nanoarchaeota archaeon]